MMVRIFRDRADAGRFLAEKLTAHRNQTDVVVLALPRGGVPVAYEVAKSLRAPLDVFLVRKLGVPGFEELAMGAIASGGVRTLNDDVITGFHITDEMVDEATAKELQELQRREQLYRGTRGPLDVTNKVVIVVDDGLATGSTMRAAVKALRQKHPKKIIVAVPVGARDTCDSFRNAVDTLAVCAITPEPFIAVGMWYRNFSQTSDEQVQEILTRAQEIRAAA